MFDNLRAAIQRDLDELATVGHMSRAAALSKSTKQRFNTDTLPQYFTGRLDAPIVLVHLNPKQDDDPRHKGTWTSEVKDIAQYLDECEHFGRRMYGAEAKGEHKSPFDKKQIRFLSSLGAMEFEPGDSKAAILRNLEKVVDDKLQLEIVPYGSPTFRNSAAMRAALAPYWDQVLDVILEDGCPRQWVLFCGRVFEPLIREYIVGPVHEFNLKTAAGHHEAKCSRFARLEIVRHRDGRVVRAGWAPSFSRQGIPMYEYGAKCAELYW